VATQLVTMALFRATGDIDIWININPINANKVVMALQEFGFAVPELSSEIFLQKERIVRMGIPPMRLEILTTILKKCSS